MKKLEDLAKKAKNNPRQFEKLYKKTVDKAMAYFYAKTGNHADTEDLVQELYLKLYRYLGSYEERGGFSSFFYSVARSIYADWVKKKKVQSKDAEFEAQSKGSDNDSFANSILKMELFEALRKLDETDREIIILYFFQDLKNEEIAQALNMTVENVKVRKHRALKKLRSIMGV
jgi:RNA polymerase sigma-70 factor (ECF subfamily)